MPGRGRPRGTPGRPAGQHRARAPSLTWEAQAGFGGDTIADCMARGGRVSLSKVHATPPAARLHPPSAEFLADRNDLPDLPDLPACREDAAMLKLWNPAGVLDRRELLRVGGLSLAGLSLPFLLRQQAQARPAGKSF